MNYYVIVFFIVAFLFVLAPSLIRAFHRRKKSKLISRLRENWGNPIKDKDYNFSYVNVFHEIQTDKKSDKCYVLNESSINELDINQVFASIDNTHSKVGEQYLYFLLCRPRLEGDDLQKLDNEINHFSANENEREEIQFLLSKLNGFGTYFLPYIFLGEKKNANHG